MEVQTQEISRLQKELGEKSQTISDLKSQLEARDDELDYLHGQLAIQEALENEQDEKITKEQMAKNNTDVDKLSLEDLQMANEELSKVKSLQILNNTCYIALKFYKVSSYTSSIFYCCIKIFNPS